VGTVLGGWWIGFIALGLYAVALALCFPVVGMFIGRWLLDRFGKAGTPVLLTLLLGWRSSLWWTGCRCWSA
jgi:hypothetical protein